VVAAVCSTAPCPPPPHCGGQGQHTTLGRVGEQWGWGGVSEGGLLLVGGEIGVAGRARLAPTCGEVCVRHSTEQMRALSPVIFHIFFFLNKTKTM